LSIIQDKLAFEAAIKGSPLDLTPRLVYADWLDDHHEHELAASLRDEGKRHIVDTYARVSHWTPGELEEFITRWVWVEKVLGLPVVATFPWGHNGFGPWALLKTESPRG
jgi:uncharacterized protein (TIGR02996 family)